MKAFTSLMVFCLCCLGITRSYGTGSDEVFQEANYLLQTHQESHYDHKTVIDEKRGYYRMDCSSLVCYVLSKRAPIALGMIPKDVHHSHARAQNFYDYFKTLETMPNAYWMAVRTVTELKRGDIIVWKYDPMLRKKDTGHIVIVAETPVQEEAYLYRIRVIDASRGQHAKDTRVAGKDGIGSGDMWFRVDENNFPVGLYWSSKEKQEARHSIAMGRVLKIIGGEKVESESERSTKFLLQIGYIY